MNQDLPTLSQTANKTILIVDDNAANISLITQILAGRGYNVRVAPNGRLAIQSCQINPPDLILLDITMPVMSGYDVCQALKQNERTQHVPIIFISALDDPLDMVHAFMVGGADYITKPLKPLEVLVRVENQLRLRDFQTQLEAQNARLELLLNVTRAIQYTEDVGQALKMVLRMTCETIGWDFAKALVPNAQETMLHHSSGWYCSDSGLGKFREQNLDLQFAPGQGLAGRVWMSKQAEWIESLSQTPDRFLAAASAIQAGLNTVMALPVLGNSKVLAVFVFLRKQQTAFEQTTLDLVNAVVAQVGALIQQKKSEEALIVANLELERLATLDGLTQVSNRRQFDQFLQQEWRRSLREQQPLSLLLCDVDHFKAFNDHYGHLKGDDCLRQVAQTLENATRRPTDLVARYGGEEFAIILPNTAGQGALTVAKTIQSDIQALAIPHSRSSTSPQITVSLGVASVVPMLERSPEYLLCAADEALYQAKLEGRNRLVFKLLPLD